MKQVEPRGSGPITPTAGQLATAQTVSNDAIGMVEVLRESCYLAGLKRALKTKWSVLPRVDLYDMDAEPMEEAYVAAGNIVRDVLQAGLDQQLDPDEARALLGRVLTVMREKAETREGRGVTAQMPADPETLMSMSAIATLRKPADS